MLGEKAWEENRNIQGDIFTLDNQANYIPGDIFSQEKPQQAAISTSRPSRREGATIPRISPIFDHFQTVTLECNLGNGSKRIGNR
jgi:hypothetical protein